MEESKGGNWNYGCRFPDPNGNQCAPVKSVVRLSFLSRRHIRSEVIPCCHSLYSLGLSHSDSYKRYFAEKKVLGDKTHHSLLCIFFTKATLRWLNLLDKFIYTLKSTNRIVSIKLNVLVLFLKCKSVYHRFNASFLEEK